MWARGSAYSCIRDTYIHGIGASHQCANEESSVGTRLLLRDARVDLWAFALAPGERCAFHTHRRPYAFVNLEPSWTQALTEDGTAMGEPAYQRAGQITFVSREHLGSHGVHNIGEEAFVQFVVEFKD